MAPSWIKPEIATYPSIHRTLRYIEWTILVTLCPIVPLHGDNVVQENFVTFACLGGLALLSLKFPINRRIWQKRAYIILEILLLIPTKMINWNFEILLYLYLAKSCFLLTRKDVAVTVITGGIAWQLALIWSLPESIDFICSHSPDLCDPKSIIFSHIINDIASYLTGSTFVILFSLVVIAEQKSRQKALALAQQVETLAANLERTRIARDIHDSLGHTLTTLDVQLELALRLYDRNPDKAQKALYTAKELASQSIADVRRSLQTMREKDFDLNKALVTLVEHVKQNQPFDVHLQLNLPALPLQTSHQLYCIVQEGLTNVQRHAHASRISLRGQPTPEGIILELEDDGIGFDPGLPCSGFGLGGMQERVQILGGQLKINSTLGQGTQIQVRIPLCFG